MFHISEVTKEPYYDEECVFFRNPLQIAKYLNWNAKLIDIFADSQDKLVCVFSKADHEVLKHKWGWNKNKTNSDLNKEDNDE